MHLGVFSGWLARRPGRTGRQAWRGRRGVRIIRGRLRRRGELTLAPAAVGRRLHTGADDVADEVHLPPAGVEDGQHRTSPHHLVNRLPRVDRGGWDRGFRPTPVPPREPATAAGCGTVPIARQSEDNQPHQNFSCVELPCQMRQRLGETSSASAPGAVPVPDAAEKSANGRRRAGPVSASHGPVTPEPRTGQTPSASAARS